MQKSSESNPSSKNTKNSPWNLQFLEKKRRQLQQQHEKRRKAQQVKQEELRKHKININEEKQLLNNTRNSSSKTLQKLLSKYDQQPQPNFIHNEIGQIQEPIKKVGIEDILRDGRIVKVIERTLTFDQYKVLCLYDQQILELIASKDEIVRNNIIPLLDFYERTLGLM